MDLRSTCVVRPVGVEWNAIDCSTPFTSKRFARLVPNSFQRPGHELIGESPGS
jgi:hypothetical protein